MHTSGPRTRSKKTAGKKGKQAAEEGLLLGHLMCGEAEISFYSYATQSIKLEGVNLAVAVQVDGSITLAHMTREHVIRRVCSRRRRSWLKGKRRSRHSAWRLQS
jgi:hypothetical protein